MSGIMEMLEENDRIRKEDQAVLKSLIDSNTLPEVDACTSSIGGSYTLGDLVDIGYASKEYITGMDGEVENIEWFYHGTYPIMLVMMVTGTKVEIQPYSII